jgi:hypothetical protein
MRMTSEEKIYKVLEKIKAKIDIAPIDSVIDYRAGEEVNKLSASDEILILNKLSDEGVIEIIDNFTSDYI